MGRSVAQWLSGNALQDFEDFEDNEKEDFPANKLVLKIPIKPATCAKRCVFEKGVANEMMREMLSLYSFEAGFTSSTPEVLSKWEQLFRLQAPKLFNRPQIMIILP